MKKSKRHQAKMVRQQTPQDDYASWQFVANLTEEMMTRATKAIDCVKDLRQQERTSDIVEMERLGLLFRTNRSLQTILKTVACLDSLAKYSCLDTLDCPDKILLNRFCGMLVMCGEIKAGFTTTVPDYFSFRTNEQALWKLLETVILQSVARLYRRQEQTGDIRLELSVALKNVSDKIPGYLVFTVVDNGDRMRPDDIEAAFTLPDEPTLCSTEIHERLELRLCWQIARLLNGAIRIDPNYFQGRRVIVKVPVQRILDPAADLQKQEI